MKNLFINHIKKMAKQKSKFLGLLMLVILSVSIYSSMINLFSPLKPVISSFDKEYQAEDFRISFDQNYLQDKITEKNLQLVEDMSEEKQKKLVEEAVRSFETDNQLLLEENKSKQLIQINGDLKQNYIFVTDMNQINKSKIIEGRLPEKKAEIAMNPQALETLDLKVGDTLKIDKKDLKIVGTLLRPDYIALSNLSVPSSIAPENNFLVLSSQLDYGKVNANEKNFYSGRFNGKPTKIKKNLDKLSKNGDIQLEYATENTQMSALTDRIKSNEVSGVYFAALILMIASFMIGFIIKRDLQEQKKTIGVFKAQGYKSSELVVPYITYALFLSVIGSVVGYLLGYFISKELRKSFLIYFNVPKVGEQFPVINLLAVTGIVTLLLTILILMITFSMIRKPTVDLLKDTGNTKKKKIIFRKKNQKEKNIRSFLTQLMSSFFLRSGKKNLIIVFATLFTTFLLLVSFVQFQLPNQTIEAAEKQIDYKYLVSYFRPQNTKQNEGQRGYNNTAKIIKINQKNESIHSVAISLLDFSEKNYWTIMNLKEKDISSEIRDNHVAVSKFFQQIYGLSKGDNLKIQIENKTLELTVSDIVDDLSQTIYGDFNGEVFKDIHAQKYNELCTNKKYQDNDKEYQIVSVQEYISNASLVAKQLQAGSYTIGLIALIISFILINISSSMSVEENKKNIAVLEILGYSNKEIEKVLFRIPLFLVISVSFIANLFSPYVFSAMEDQLIAQLGSPAEIDITLPMSIMTFVLTVSIFFIVQQIQKRNIRKINSSEVLFEE